MKKRFKQEGIEDTRQKSLEFMDYCIEALREKMNNYRYNGKKTIKIKDEIMII